MSQATESIFTPSAAAPPRRPALSRYVRFMRRWPVIPLVIVVGLITMAVFAPLLTSHSPIRGDLRSSNMPPAWMDGGSSRFIMGTDTQGRDILTRIMFGARISLVIVSIVLVSGVIYGATLGMIAGYVGGNVDELIMRYFDFVMAVPFLLVAMVLVIVFGQSLTLIVLMLVIFSGGGFARQARGITLTLKTSEYVDFARVAGASPARILFRHILPGTINTITVVASLSVGGLILAEATLSFLGVGVPGPTPAWGVMVADGRNYLGSDWWIATFPGLAIFLTVFAVNFLGDWLRDHLDPRLRQVN